MSASRNRIIGGFEDAIERGQSATKNAAKQAASDFANSAKGQLTGSVGQNSTTSSDQVTNENANAAQNSQQQPQMSDADRVEFLRNLYGKSDSSKKNNSQSKPANSNSVAQALGIPKTDPNAGKSPEEIAKIEALRSQLHSDYYQETFNRKKPKEEPVAEKLEREEEEEKMSDLQEQKKKPPPLPATVKQGTGESVVGMSG